MDIRILLVIVWWEKNAVSTAPTSVVSAALIGSSPRKAKPPALTDRPDIFAQYLHILYTFLFGLIQICVYCHLSGLFTSYAFAKTATHQYNFRHHHTCRLHRIIKSSSTTFLLVQGGFLVLVFFFFPSKQPPSITCSHNFIIDFTSHPHSTEYMPQL